jgi:1-phosphofructokinase family hexose kinase
MKPALVVSLNPAVDAEWRVDRVRWEEKNVLESENRWAGGKGINVARWFQRLGGRVRLLLPLGGGRGREIAGGLRAEGLDASIVPIRANSRINVVVTASIGGQIRFNQPGPVLSPAEWRAVVREFTRLLPKISCVIISGSIPPGLSSGAYAILVRLARRAGVETIVDCDGRALRAAAWARPVLVKPNLYELAQWARESLRTESAMIRAARSMARMTGGWVLVSRGKQGAALVGKGIREIIFACPPRLTPVSTVGAGDALLAAAVSQMLSGAPPQEWVRCGVAAGSAATQSTGGRTPSNADIRAVWSRVTVRSVTVA